MNVKFKCIGIDFIKHSEGYYRIAYLVDNIEHGLKPFSKSFIGNAVSTDGIDFDKKDVYAICSFYTSQNNDLRINVESFVQVEKGEKCK